MRQIPVLLLVVLATSRTAAQPAFEPGASVSLLGGVSPRGPYWSVSNQPEVVPGSSPADFDTLSLGRTLRTGLAATLLVSYRKSPHVAITGELSWYGLRSTQQCANIAPYVPEPEHYNQQICESADGRDVASGVAALMLGGSWQFSEGVVRPYLRGSAGIGEILNSFVQTIGHLNSARCANGIACEVEIYTAERDVGLTWLALLAAGTTVGDGQDIRLQLEVRLVSTSLPTIPGPTPPSAVYTTIGTTVRIFPVMIVGAELPLTRKRERRY